MKYFILFTLSISILVGCAINPAVKYVEEMKLYIAENRPLALSGTIKWTTYYEGGLSLAKKIPPNIQGRSDEISDWLESINVAKEYEAGRLTKEEFYKWREASNAKVEANNNTNRKNHAQCEYEAKVGAAGVRDTGRSGLNLDQIYKEKELFDLCMKAKAQ
jgi:hypothetical protein